MGNFRLNQLEKSYTQIIKKNLTAQKFQEQKGRIITSVD